MVSCSQKNQFPLARISFFLKNWFPLTAVTVSAGRKKLSSKVTVSIREKNPPLAGFKDSFKNKFSRDRKKLSLAESLRKYIKKWFVLAIRFH